MPWSPTSHALALACISPEGHKTSEHGSAGAQGQLEGVERVALLGVVELALRAHQRVQLDAAAALVLRPRRRQGQGGSALLALLLDTAGISFCFCLASASCASCSCMLIRQISMGFKSILCIHDALNATGLEKSTYTC